MMDAMVPASHHHLLPEPGLIAVVYDELKVIKNSKSGKKIGGNNFSDILPARLSRSFGTAQLRI